MAPKVSILIPTYNYACYIDEAIQSVLNQTFCDFELIIVDDLSKDNTDEVVQKYLSDDRISYYKNPTRLGLPGNWNKCLSLAKGEYIDFLMADDKFHPEKLEKFVAVFDRHPSVSLVTSYREIFNSDKTIAATEQYFPPFSSLQNGKKIIQESLNTFNWIGEPTTVMFRRSNLCIGEFAHNYKWIPDWDMWFRQLTVGDCFIIPEILSYFRKHENQATVALGKSFKRQFEEYEFYKNIQVNNPYKINLKEVNFSRILLLKGASCFKSSIKSLFRFGVRNSWSRFKWALKIFFNEGLFLNPLLILLPAKTYHSFNLLKKKAASGFAVFLKF